LGVFLRLFVYFGLLFCFACQQVAKEKLFLLFFGFEMGFKSKSKMFKLSTKQAFTLFSKETSLHGWSYLSRETTEIWKKVLFAFLLAIIVITVALTWTNTNQVSCL
jgi:hypothetical protein